jgi:hypothetical protein
MAFTTERHKNILVSHAPCFVPKHTAL